MIVSRITVVRLVKLLFFFNPDGCLEGNVASIVKSSVECPHVRGFSSVVAESVEFKLAVPHCADDVEERARMDTWT